MKIATRRVRGFLALLPAAAPAGVLTLLGCAGSHEPKLAAPPPVPLVWPAPPEQPRIAYVQSLSRPADLGARRSAFGRFANWITGSDHGNEKLVKPFGVALDENDNLCLTDTGANVVCYFDHANNKWSRWDRINKRRFVSPVAVARRNGTFYVADTGLECVVAFGSDGKLVCQITNRLERPSGLAIVQDRLFVTDARRHCVVVFNLRGEPVTEFGRRGTGPGEFNFPTHIAADAAGTLFITDSMNSRVQVFGSDGTFKSQIGSLGDSSGHFSRPKGVAADGLGHVYVVDAMFDNLQVFDAQGRFLLFLGDAGARPGQFWLPNGIAISRQNEIFVADSYNHRVQVLKYIGPP